MQSSEFDPVEYLGQVREIVRAGDIKIGGQEKDSAREALDNFAGEGREYACDRELLVRRIMSVISWGAWTESNPRWIDEVEKKFRAFGRVSERAHRVNPLIPSVHQLSTEHQTALRKQFLDDFLGLSRIIGSFRNIPVLFMSPSDLQQVIDTNPDLLKNIIRYFARGNPGDVPGAIQRFERDVEQQSKDNPDLPEGLIRRLVRGNPGDVPGAVQRFRSGRGGKTGYESLLGA